ncbi:hypothetical protein A2U01_0065987, partial [Trifolium medium]|nr:hypothetical protein [Trifolium medium]
MNDEKMAFPNTEKQTSSIVRGTSGFSITYLVRETVNSIDVRVDESGSKLGNVIIDDQVRVKVDGSNDAE